MKKEIYSIVKSGKMAYVVKINKKAYYFFYSEQNKNVVYKKAELTLKFKKRINNVFYKYDEDSSYCIVHSEKYGDKIVIVDNEFVDILQNHKINVKTSKRNKNFYAWYGQVKLHRFIMSTPDNLVVDHINHNSLDNRKSNLRNVSIRENNRNIPKNRLHPVLRKNSYIVRYRNLDGKRISVSFSKQKYGDLETAFKFANKFCEYIYEKFYKVK